MMLLSQRPSSVASAHSKSSTHNKHLHPEASQSSNNTSNNNNGSSSQIRANANHPSGPGRPTSDVATRALTHPHGAAGGVAGNATNASSSSSLRGASTDLNEILFAELLTAGQGQGQGQGPGRHTGTGAGTGTNDNNHPAPHTTTNSAVAAGEQQPGAISSNPPKQRSLSRPAGAYFQPFQHALSTHPIPYQHA